MKRTNNILIAALAGITLSLITVSAQSQVKGGERLLQLNGSSATATVTPSDFKPMSCSKCRDISTNVRDFTAKGASALVAHEMPTKTVAQHLCEGCVTTTATVGVGKHAKDVVTHKCAGCGSENMACCNTSKGASVATKGMDAAPLK
jgi:hypothetical protein